MNNSDEYKPYLRVIKKVTCPIETINYSTVLKYPNIYLSNNFYYIIYPDGILTDDGKVCKYCTKNITYINTPMAILSLKLWNIIGLSVFV